MSDTPSDDERPTDPAGTAPQPAAEPAEPSSTAHATAAAPPPPGTQGWVHRPPVGPPGEYPRGGWSRWRGGRGIPLLLAGLIGLLIGCTLGGIGMAAVAVVSHHDRGPGYHHHMNRDDYGPRRPGKPMMPAPQPRNS